jgi:hypothetical protein
LFAVFFFFFFSGIFKYFRRTPETCFQTIAHTPLFPRYKLRPE